MNGQLQSWPSACPHHGEQHPYWHLHKAACRGCSHSFIPSNPSCNLNFTAQLLSYSIKLSVFLTMLSFCCCLVPIIYPLSYYEHCCWWRKLLKVGGVGVQQQCPGILLQYSTTFVLLLAVCRHCRPQWCGGCLTSLALHYYY